MQGKSRLRRWPRMRMRLCLHCLSLYCVPGPWNPETSCFPEP